MSRDDDRIDSDRAGDAIAPRQNTALFGHSAAEAELLDGYRRGKLAQAWIIGGAQGIGKATLAWRFARFVLAHPDSRSVGVANAVNLYVSADNPAARKIAAGSHGDVFTLRREWNEKTKNIYTEIRANDVRSAVHLFQKASGEGGWRICILDSAEDLNRSGANALLKLIEEPPPRSLFLIIAQRPGQVLPTIRSHCRKLILQPLPQEATIMAIKAQGPELARMPAGELAQIASQADGSVREALRLIDGGSRGFDARLQALLRGLPRLDWRAVHTICDEVVGREGEDSYEVMKQSIWVHLSKAVRQAAAEQASPTQLAPLAQVWEKIGDNLREAEALNLDRRALTLGLFADMALAFGGG